MSHLSKDGVDKFMLHIKKAVNLRAEAELSLGSYAANKLREESKDALRDAEYMVYELIDGAVERSVDHAYRSIRQSAAVTGRSEDQRGNIPTAKEREE
jgi:hypothetical protein